MTTLKTFIGTVALLAASTVFAQSDKCELFPTGSTEGQGTIGRRYAEGYLSVQNVSHSSDDIFGIGVVGNVPFCKGIDLIGNLGYSSYKPDMWSTTLTSFEGAVRVYNSTEDDVKPFVQAGLGMSFGEVRDNSTNWVNWSVGVGAEFAYKWVSITPSIVYRDDLRHRGPSVQSLNYAVEASSWANEKVGIFLKLTAVDVMNDRDVELNVTAGVRVRF